jgi:WD40 repeat protein
LLTGSTRGAFIWDIEADELVRELKGLTNGVTAVAVSPNGGQVLTASTDNTAKLWDTASGQLLRTFGGDTNRIGSIAFNVDGTEILVASDDGTIRFWEVSSGQARQVYDWGRGGGGSCAALSLDGHRLLSLLDGDARLWDLQTGQVQWTLEGWWLSGPAGFSPDGRTVAIGNRLIDAQAGHVLRELRWELYDPEWDLRMSVDGSCGGFSPDGQRLLTTHGLWDVASGQPTLLFDVLDGNALDVSAVATLSSDGLLAATGNRDGTVNLWDIGRLSARLRLVTSSQGLQVRWDKGTLQSAETVNGPWQDMTNAVSPFPADVVAGNKFYRVKVEE